MSAPLKNLGAITMFVADKEAAKAFYRSAFEIEPLFEDEVSAVFDIGNTIINLLEESEAPGLIAPAKVAGRDAGSRVQLTVWVDDANAVSAALNARGIALLNGPIDRPWGMRTAIFSDPDGHIWEIAQDLSKVK